MHLLPTLSRATAIAALTLIVIIGFPQSTQAQSYRDWRSYWNTREGKADDDSRSSRGVSSSVQRKINDLDDDEVKNLPIPILFGISVNQLTKNFGDPRDGGERTHEGLDILAPKRAYIVSPTDAVVTRTGNGESSGIYVYTANPGGEVFRYMHLDEVAKGVQSGTVLKPGDLIGYVGNTGNAAGGPTHLHFEVRDGRTATDPYPRLTKEFTLKERIAAVEDVLDKADDEEEEAESLVSNYRSIFLAARAADIKLPNEIDDALGEAGVPDNTIFTRDLVLGTSGADVTALQGLLIAKDSGPKAKALLATGATGYFGALTQAALIEYQQKESINPASGYFGPITRARITAH